MPTRSKTAKASSGRTDWGRIDRMTEAEIERMAASDKENPATKQADWATAKIGLPPLKTPGLFPREDAPCLPIRGNPRNARHPATIRTGWATFHHSKRPLIIENSNRQIKH